MSGRSGISRFPRSSEIVLRCVSGKSGQGLDQAKIDDRLSIPDIHNSKFFSFLMSEMIADHLSNLGCVGKIEHSWFLWFFPGLPVLTAISAVWFGVFISRQNLGWSRNSIPRSSGIFSTYENQTRAISYWAYTRVCETDTVLPILLCKTNLDISSLPELAKVKVKRIFGTLCEKMHHGKKQKVPSESSARNWMTIEWSHYRIWSIDSKVRTTY